MSELFNLFWESYPPRNGKRLNKPEAQRLFSLLSANDQLLCVTATRHYAESQRVRDNIGIKDPNRFICGGKGDEPWRDWLDAEVVTVVRANGHHHGGFKTNMDRLRENTQRTLDRIQKGEI